MNFEASYKNYSKFSSRANEIFKTFNPLLSINPLATVYLFAACELKVIPTRTFKNACSFTSLVMIVISELEFLRMQNFSFSALIVSAKLSAIICKHTLRNERES